MISPSAIRDRLAPLRLGEIDLMVLRLPVDQPDLEVGPVVRLEPRVLAVAQEDDDLAAYGVHEAEVVPEERAPVEVVKPTAEETRLLDRSDAPKPPTQVWTAEVFAFLIQPATISVVLILSAMCFAVGGVVRIAREFNPIADGR